MLVQPELEPEHRCRPLERRRKALGECVDGSLVASVWPVLLRKLALDQRPLSRITIHSPHRPERPARGRVDCEELVVIASYIRALDHAPPRAVPVLAQSSG